MRLLFLRVCATLFVATLLLSPIFSLAQSDPKVSLNVKSATLSQVIKEIEKQTGLSFFYSPEDFSAAKNLNLSESNQPLSVVLKQISLQTGFDFSLIEKTIYIRRKSVMTASTEQGTVVVPIIIKGKIISATDGAALAGAIIILKKSDKGVVAAEDGSFSIQVPSQKSILIVTNTGYLSKEVEIGTQLNPVIMMVESEKKLDEVVVVGYGSQLKKNYAGASVKIGAKDIRNQPIISADYAIQGQAAGVQVTSNSSTPGGGVRIFVRGLRSINANNEPLFIVDGVPVLTGNLVGENLGGETQNLLAGINPADIESINILKDASSTAIYGARGANGVVVITTKKGSKGGKSTIDANYNTGFGNFVQRWNMLGASDYKTLINESRVNVGLAPYASFEGDVNTNWQDIMNRTQHYQDAQLSLRGGNDQTQFYISGGFRDETGAVLGIKYKRGTFRTNLNHKVNNKLTIGTTLTVSRELNQRVADNNGSGSPYQGGVGFAPTLPAYKPDGSFYVPNIGLYGVNPLIDVNGIRYDNTTSKIIGNLNLNYKILPELTFRTDFSIDYNVLREDHFYATGTTRTQSIPAALGNGGYYSNTEATTYAIEPTLTYEKKIKDQHQFSALLGTTFQNRSIFRGFMRGEGLGSSNQLTYLNAAVNARVNSSSRLDYAFSSIFGRLGYTFKDKYIVNATVRRDGSSRFGSGNQFGTFMAGSAAWNFSEESLFKKADWLSFGKLRLGYGITGNDQIGDFRYISSWSAGGYINQNGLFPTQIANPNLKWEQTGTLDAGIELGFNKDRYTLSLGYYSSTTKDLLFFLPVSGMTGFSEVATNLGKVRNSGIEIQASAVLVNAKNFTWRVNGNITFQKNKVVQLPIAPITYGFTASAIEEGQSIGTFKTYQFDGVNVATGNSLYKDLNGDSLFNALDQKVLGKGIPDFFGGINNSFRLRNLTLDVFVNFMQNFELFNVGRWIMENRFSGMGNYPIEAMARWQKPGDVTNIPKLSYFSSQNTRISSNYISDASFVRVKNITLGYELTPKTLQRLQIRSARFFITATNLFTITKYSGIDPEVSGLNVDGPPNIRGVVNSNIMVGNDFFTPPQLKQFIIGINLGL